MISSSVIRLSLALLAATAVAGCLGSSTGGGSIGGGGNTGGGSIGGGGNTGGSDSGDGDGDDGDGGTAGFEEHFDRASSIIPTQDMPTRLQATYAGQMRADVSQGSDIVGEVVAALDLDVDWTDGQTSNPFSGTASSFQGRAGDGEFETINGTLVVDPAFEGVIRRTVIPASTVGGYAVPEVQTGSMMVTLSGELTHEADTVDATLTLGGNFHGSGASAAVGAVTGGFDDPNAGGSIFDGAIGGMFYLERQ